MNFDNLISLAASVVLGFAAINKIDTLQMWIWKAQARVAHESRSSNWGSPRFFAERLPQSVQRNQFSKRSNINRRLASPRPSADINQGGAI